MEGPEAPGALVEVACGAFEAPSFSPCCVSIGAALHSTTTCIFRKPLLSQLSQSQPSLHPHLIKSLRIEAR